jgi:hypothetical protein
MISKRLMAIIGGMALFATATATETLAVSEDMAMAQASDDMDMDMDADVDADADADADITLDDELDSEVKPTVYYHHRRHFYHPRPVVIGSEQIPRLVSRMPYIQYSPYHYPHVVVPQFLARRLLSQLYNGSPKAIYSIMRQLPGPARYTLRRLIARAADPASYVPICSSFLSAYTETTPDMAFAETGNEVDFSADADADAEVDADADADEELDAEEDPAFVEVDAEADEETAIASDAAAEAEAPHNAAVDSLNDIAATLESQATLLAAKLAEAKKNQKPSPFATNRGAVGRMYTNSTRRVPDEGMHSWEAVAKANVLRNGTEGQPIAVQQAEYLSVEASPRQ